MSERVKARVVVIGCNQWGDSGKGAIVDQEMEHADIGVRNSGADNCGHTAWYDGKKIVTHAIPTSIIWDRAGKVSVIGSGVLFNPLTARNELEQLSTQGITSYYLKLSYRAKLLLPHHIVLDMISEAVSSQGTKIGTTGRGVGPCVRDHVGRVGLTVGDMLDPMVFEQKLTRALRDVIPFLKTHDIEIVKKTMMTDRLENGQFFDAENIFNIPEIVRRYGEHGKYFRRYICDVEAYVGEVLQDPTRSIVFEGAQGALLDINRGTYPYVTSTDTTILGMVQNFGLTLDDVDEPIGVVKAYVTRVGEGPFPTEIGGYNAVNTYLDLHKDMVGHSLLEQLNSDDPILVAGALLQLGGEFGATTGRPRRVGYLDLPALRYALEFNGRVGALTKLDVLTGMQKIPVCVAYYYEGSSQANIGIQTGKRYNVAPSVAADYFQYFKPVYVYLDGWKKDISGVREFSDLPLNAQEYIKFIESRAGIKFGIIRVGQDRNQFIDRR